MFVSIFNDVIGPVMRGPSSSHCAAALRIGRLARHLMEGELQEVLVEFDRSGSLPTTHDTQGSDMGLFGGLMGWEAADERLPGSMQALQESGVKIRIETLDVGDPHPNTYRLTLVSDRERHTLRAISTGGGMMEVVDVDGFAVSMSGDYYETLLWPCNDGAALRDKLAALVEADVVLLHERGPKQLVEVKAQQFVPDEARERLMKAGLVSAVKQLPPVLPVLSRRTTRVPYTTCAEMLAFDAGRNTPLSKLAIDYECARGGLREEEAVEKMVGIVRILRRSIAEGLAGSSYEDRVLGHQCGEFQRLMQEGRLLNAGALNRIILYVTALMEVKSSMGVIVAMPTAGACAALPGAVIAMAEEMGLDEEAMARAILASGLIGVFIATAWTFAAEVGGCQAEGGSAAAMAAAALVTMAGGSLDQSVAAASMAMQSMLGLICDPIANRVEAPCLGKNVMAAANALSCANMALAGFDQVIPLDEVIEAAKQVAKQMPRELRCTACHAASGKQGAWLSPKKAPLLAEFGKRANPEFIRQHLLAPHQASPGTTMPDMLHGLPASERDSAAEALTHFVFSTSAPTWKRVAPDKSAVARGESLFHRVGCVACHGPQNRPMENIAASSLPPMSGKWSIAGLRQFLLDPLASRPSGRMPAMALTGREAEDLAHYLLRETKVFSPLEAAVYLVNLRSLDEIDTATAARTLPVESFALTVPGAGSRLALRFSGWLRVDEPGDYTFYLTADGASRMSVDGIWIEDEGSWRREATRAAGAQRLEAGWHPLKVDFVQRGQKPPALRVEWEGPGIARETIPAARLRADRDVEPAAEPAPFLLDAARAARGRTLFAELNCAACHEDEKPGAPLPRLDELQPNRGCLADTPAAGTPHFHLSNHQRGALQEALSQLRAPDLAPPSAQQRMTHTTQTFHCTACHERDGSGGVTSELDAYFTSNVDDLGDEGRLPPSLDGVGDRLRPDWLAKALAEGSNVRPYLNTRMPQFGAKNVGHLTELYVALDRQPQPLAPATDSVDALREAGRQLVGTDGLSCIACHGFAGQPAHALHALDLITIPARLNEDWFRAFLRDPNRFHPGTRMPAFWPGGRSVIPAVLDGDTDRQHAALWTYLADGPRAKFPEGLSRKNMELLVGGEAVVYRGKLWEAGFRAVAIGYPGRVNAAFDSEEMRLALLWRGRFLDASPHWSMQGMGQIRPLGTDVVIFPRGSALAVLDSADAAWPSLSSREAGMKFRGYGLDSHERPTLRYVFRDVAVEDFLMNLDAGGKPALHRTVTFSGPRLDGLHLRIAAGKLSAAGQSAWRLGDAITLRVPAAAGAILRSAGGQQELLAPVLFENGKAQLEIEYVW